MKFRSILIVLISLNCISAFAQNSALLELASNNQGFSPPVMSREQMTAIGSPVEGLMVYCSDCISQSLGSVYFFDGSSWMGVFSDFNLLIKKLNLETQLENLGIQLENLQIQLFAIEARNLECQLKALEQGGG